MTNRGRQGAKDADSLRARVRALTQELDQVEDRLERAGQAVQAAVQVLAGPWSREAALAAALSELKRSAAARPLEPGRLERAVGAFKDALMAEKERQELPPAAAPGGPAHHLLIAALAALRMGQPEFDQQLEEATAAIEGHLARGEVRPAVALLAELLARYREALEDRRKQAEDALSAVLQEVFSTQEELGAALENTSAGLAQGSRDYEKRLNSSLGYLVKDVNQAQDLATLKTQALGHLRQMREIVKARQQHDHRLLTLAQRELQSSQAKLAAARKRMARAEETRRRLSQEAYSDPMTGLPNKRSLEKAAGEALSSALASPVCLIVFDIDHFKAVNDNYGHQAGDRALKAIAQRVNAGLRQNDTLFRYAGDEFVALLPQTPLPEGKLVAERVRQAAETLTFTYGESAITITVTLGISQARPGEDWRQVFERADQALLAAKRGGRNTVMAA